MPRALAVAAVAVAAASASAVGPVIAVVAVALGGGGGCDASTPAPDAAALAAAEMDWDAFCLQMSAAEQHREAVCFNQWPELARAPSRLPVCDFVAASLRAGRARLGDMAAAADCLATIDGLGCDPSVRLPSPADLRCPALVRGTAPTGASCAFSFDCAGPGSQTCVRSARSCVGTCQPRRHAGGACAYDADCVPALACDPRSGVCAPRAALGAACGAGVGVCETTLHCDAVTATCLAYPIAGPCFNGICAAGWSCRYGMSGAAAAGVCGPFPAAGDPCTPGMLECQPPAVCLPSPGAESTGTCSPPPRVGDACVDVLSGAELIEQQECLDGWCDRPPGALGGVCRPFRQLGDSCLQSSECDAQALRRCGAGGVCAAATCVLGD